MGTHPIFESDFDCLTERSTEMEKPWETFFTPVKKGREYEDDIGAILDQFMTDGMVKEDGRTDFVTGAMVIQGATDTICKRIDKLHDETLAAVGNLTLDENDVAEGGDNEGGTKRTRNKRKSLYRRCFDGELVDSEELGTEDTLCHPYGQIPEGQVLIPPTKPCFRDPIGEERGHELFDVHSKDYVAHAGDLWCYRVKVTTEGLLLPGQSRKDPGLQLLREQTADAEGSGLDPISSEEARDYEENPFRYEDPTPQHPIPPNIELSGSSDPQVHEADRQEEISFRDAPFEAVDEDRLLGQFLEEENEYENDDDRMDTGADENQNSQIVENEAEVAVAVASQKNLNCNKLMDLNSTEFKLKFNPRHRYDNFLPTRTREQEAEKMKVRATMLDYGKDPYVEKTIQEVLWRDYHNFYRRKRLQERKKQIAKHNKRWKAYLLKHAHPRKLGRYHREAAERNVPVQEVVAEDIGIAGQTAEDIPARVFEGLVVNDEAPQYIPGPNDNFDPPEYNPDYDDMPPADEFDDMPENPTTESNFETDLIQIARSHLNRLQQRYRDNEMQAAVRNWRERMEPVLAMEEEREPFNIRRTIKRIDECLVDRQERHWDELIDVIRSTYDFRTHEYCQYFAATLQMANEGKLKIRHKDPDSQDDPENPNFGDGNFSVERIPDSEREEVAGDDVDLERDELNSSKRARADTTSSEQLQIRKPPTKKGRRLQAQN